MTATCGGCDTRWSGLAIAHCGGCHHTFSGVTLFDLHRRRSRCTDPAAIRHKGEPLVRSDVGVWRYPAMPPEALAARKRAKK
jgi:hypothetical protein